MTSGVPVMTSNITWAMYMYVGEEKLSMRILIAMNQSISATPLPLLHACIPRTQYDRSLRNHRQSLRTAGFQG